MDKRRYNLYKYLGADSRPELERGNLLATDVVLQSLRPLFHGAPTWHHLGVGEQTTHLSGMGSRYVVLRIQDAS